MFIWPQPRSRSARHPRRTGRRALASLLAFGCLALAAPGAAAGSSSTAPPVLTAPATGSSTSSPIAISYTLPDTPLSGSVSLVFSNANVTQTLHLADSTARQAVSFTIATNDPKSSSQWVVSESSGGIPDGTYTVALAYQDSAGDPAASAVATGVVVDTTTTPPTLSAPLAGDVSTASLPVSFTLPEAASPGTVTLGLSGPGGTYELSLGDTTAGAHSLTLNPSDPSASPDVQSVSGGSTIAPGVYDVTLGYQDALGNPLATASASGVAVEACAPGTYSSSGFPVCIPAPPGHYVSGAEATVAPQCPAGDYAGASGSVFCTPAPPGSYVDTTGASRATPCPAGSFSATVGSAFCTPAPPGSDVETTGASAATLCPAGSFSATSGSTSCTPAAVGDFVAAPGATAQTPCPTGTITTLPGQTYCVTAALQTAPTPVTGTTGTPATPTTTTAPTTTSAAPPVAPAVTVVILGARVISHGSIQLRLHASAPGSYHAAARWGTHRYGSARVHVGARGVAVITLTPTRAMRRAIGRRRRRVTILVTFTPARSGPPVRHRLSLTV